MWAAILSNDWNGQPAYWQGNACHQTPDDLWNLAEAVWRAHPNWLVEVGTGEGGTSNFLRTLVLCVRTVDKGDDPPRQLSEAFVMLDGDVYSKSSVLSDLEVYGPMARWLVVCHTVRDDWGSGPALAEWLPVHPEWVSDAVRHPTRHTWLTRT